MHGSPIAARPFLLLLLLVFMPLVVWSGAPAEHATAPTPTPASSNGALLSEAKALATAHCEERVANMTRALLDDLRVVIKATRGQALGLVLMLPLNGTTCHDDARTDILERTTAAVCALGFYMHCAPDPWDRQQPTQALFNLTAALRSNATDTRPCDCHLREP